ncbi:hypothetical protein FH972_014346 [Carpinus fangiana]|uniref:Glycosyltransferase 2-like domain-containing protein n=1 Tax=Carpinus fangiana TaxID=176857 RepID=A0A5N6R9Q5_9ROSI|nr:hypothetical protein FH972_014346 [Carpinus fangiana]
MATQNSLPLYERIQRKNTLERAIEIIILFLLLSLLIYRLLFLNDHGLTWFLAFLCESWFSFVWVIIMNNKWNPVECKTYPDNLLPRVTELPSVDMFVTTADPVLEPPIITINTVLSLLAVDYPAHKLACYVSDDGCSPLTFYSLVEASKFAKFWVPFCKKYNIQVRAPFRYFADDSLTFNDSSWEFQQEWKRMKVEYGQLCHKIEDATQKSMPCDFTGEFAEFSNVDRKNHPTIIKVMWENKEGLSNGLPHLVYVSREKRHKHPHHYKAGAMNVLTRVSALMSNAPYMLNVDCDMFVNNPKVVLHAMCLLLDPKSETEIAYVQFIQMFYNGLKDDPYGNQFVVMFEYMMRGISGIQGPFYHGTGCFHRRKIIYGLSPDTMESINGKLVEDKLLEFGSSKEMIKSVAYALKGKTGPTDHLWDSIKAANQVASYGYEYSTSWATPFQLGWIYGSITEDVSTGLTIHKRGWRSVYCEPNPSAFLGCAPSGGPAAMNQQKRWATGSLEILFSKNCPIFATLFAKLQFRQCLAYLWFFLFGLRSVYEICYVALLMYSIITNSHLLPKLLRISETVFEVTKKDQSSDVANDDDAGRFTFDESPIFVPGTTTLLLHLTALVVSLLKLQPKAHDGHGSGLGEVLCSVWLVLCFWPFLKGLFGKGKHGIPISTICKSAALALLFMHFCRRTIMG